MDRDILTRTITESVVDRCIREIEEDPKRSVRKLVDLGRQLARGRFQRQYLDLTQKMLEDEESPYYTLVRNVVRKADHDAIKTFGINLGLGSWTNGARIIRALEAEGPVSYTHLEDITVGMQQRTEILKMLYREKMCIRDRCSAGRGAGRGAGRYAGGYAGGRAGRHVGGLVAGTAGQRKDQAESQGQTKQIAFHCASSYSYNETFRPMVSMCGGGTVTHGKIF